jgi:hypothetical protein
VDAQKTIPYRIAWPLIVVLFFAPIFLAAVTQINLATQVSGILGLANGGTNSSSTTVTAHNWFGNNTGSTAAPSYEQPACGDLSNSSGGCSMSTTAAGDLSGTLPSANVVSTHITSATNTDLAAFNSTGNVVNYTGASTCTGAQAVQTITASGGVTCITTLSGSFADQEVPSGTLPTTTFTLAHTPNPAASLTCFLNGVAQRAGGADYTLATATMTFGTTVPSGSTLVCNYRY